MWDVEIITLQLSMKSWENITNDITNINFRVLSQNNDIIRDNTDFNSL